MVIAPDKIQSQEYRLIYDYKPTSLTRIGWSLKLTCGSEAHARYNKIMNRYCFSVFLWCKDFKHEKKVTQKISNRNPTVIVLFSQYCTYLFTWRGNITNNNPVSFWITPFTKIKISHAYKYQWDTPNCNITNINIAHLQVCMAITKTQFRPRNVSNN